MAAEYSNHVRISKYTQEDKCETKIEWPSEQHWLWFGVASSGNARTYILVRLRPLAFTFEGERQGPSETHVGIHLAEKIFAASHVQIGQINVLLALWRSPLKVNARGEQRHSEEDLALHLLMDKPKAKYKSAT